MKTTSSRLIGTLTLIASLSPAVGWAMPPAGAVATWIGMAVAGDDGSSSVPQADELLKQARQAMADGKYQQADSLITRAEKLNPKYSIFHTGDTPKKARQDLDKKLEQVGVNPNAGAAGGTVHGSIYTSGKSGDAGASPDPFLARREAASPPADGGSSGSAANAPAGGAPAFLPPVGSAAPVPWNPSAAGAAYPTTGAPPFNLETSHAASANPRAQSDACLLGARKALAVGDARRAAALLDQAKGFKASYGMMDDSPAKVDALLQKHNDLMASHESRDSEGYRHQYSALLMEESEGLLRWREFDEAERLANDAKQLPVEYNAIETRPDTLLQRIAGERRSGGSSPLAAQQDLVHVNVAADFAAAGSGGPSPKNKPQALDMTRQARAALAQGDIAKAEQLARVAEGLAPDSAFAVEEDRPSLVLLDIQKARLHGGSGVVAATGDMAADGGGRHLASRSIYDPANDPTRLVQAASENPVPAQPTPLPPDPAPTRDAAPEAPGDGGPPALQLFRQGERALTDGNREEAMRLFQQAYTMQDQLDPPTRQRLQDHLQMLASGGQRPAGSGDGLLEGAAARQQVLVRQVAADVSRAQSTAQSLREKDPKKALDVLQKARANVAAVGDLDTQARAALLHRLDGSIQEMQQYIQKNLAQIELDEKNRAVHEEVDQRRHAKIEVGEKLAAMVDEYNKDLEERRYPEAELIAKRAAAMDPDNPVVVSMVITSRQLRREADDLKTKDDKEDGVVLALQDCDRAAIPFSGEYKMPDKPVWEKLTKSRSQLEADGRQRQLPGDIEIEQKLSTPVSLKFKQAPLGEVLNYLAKVTQVNMHIDPQGLQAEGVTTDQPVTIDLSRDIQLKSALSLILEPLHLSYVIKDEVLKVTSEDKRHGQVYTKSYSVADLVIPIPNFGPDGREGINAALNEAYHRLGYGGAGGGGFGGAGAPLAVLADNGKPNAPFNPAVSAQMMRTIGLPGSGNGVQTGTPQPSGFGPGGLKGGAGADFDSLIDLITSTIAPQSWDSAGGAGSIAPFETNLTLVVSQTQEVHEQIADLLQQLRRLQDLQVTIEVRFITLSDNFFEQVGVDFNFNIPIKGSTTPVFGSVQNPSMVIGVNPSGTIPADGTVPTTPAGAAYPLTPNGVNFVNAPSVQYQSGSFQAAAVPAFPGLTLDTNPTTFGFAILSDIEAFFLIQAFQGDDRTNILQAPKVTLFNGQQAFVSDTSQRPFVTSVIPVVGDFAAAQQPVITVLSEGTSLTVQAVVSPDRRFVRLTVVPFFSNIGAVDTFTFQGSTTTTANTANSNGTNTVAGSTSTSSTTGSTTTSEGTTVQLPTFNFVTVTTTVSVPDGGTVLLGGIKRLSEGRAERGVPVLSKIPYINRLFKNVGIGRTTQSLMMMVTPRIIIQEEEEQKLLGTTVP